MDGWMDGSGGDTWDVGWSVTLLEECGTDIMGIGAMD